MVTPADAEARLRALLVLADLDAHVLAELAEVATWLSVPAGVRLFSVGDAPDGMYGLLDGRVRFFLEEAGRPVLTAEAGSGITFGEGALLIGGGRSRTAVVSRDAELVRISPEQFDALMARSPAVATSVAWSVAARFAAQQDLAAPHPPAVVALDTDSRDRDVDRVIDQLRAAGEPPSFALVDRREGSIEIGRQSDLVLALRSARRTPYGLDGLRAWHVGLDPLAAPPVELVLVHDGTAPPSGTAKWLRGFSFADHHHVRSGSAPDVERLLRHVRGESVGLVLGGGGARGMAHIGVLKALAELSVPIDRLGGSSIGAIIGGQAAMGLGWGEVLEVNRRVWTRRALRLDVTLPTVSVSSGRRIRRVLDDQFGDVAIEDLWLPFFCTTVNLSRFRLEVHRSGPAAEWIRASASAPGLWPPVVDDGGELHIDGGQLNNVPTDVMQLDHRGRIIAVDVCADQRPMRVARGAEPPIGIRHILRRRSRNRFPSLVDTLNRCALLGSLQHREHAAEQADVYLTPDLGAIGFGGFSRMEEAVAIGYRSTLAALAGAAIEGLRSPHAPLTPNGRRAPTRAPLPGRGASR